MAKDVKVPSVGESVTEGMIATWHVSDGSVVKRDEVLVDLETDKATVEIVAEAGGVIQIKKKVGDTVKVGEVIASIDEAAAATSSASAPSASSEKVTAESKSVAPKAPVANAAPPSGSARSYEASPAVRRIADETGVAPASVPGSGRDGRVTKGDMLSASAAAPKPAATQPATQAAADTTSAKSAKSGPAPAGPAAVSPGSDGRERREWREPMTMLRRRIAERLVASQHTAAILTTFNEIDMTAAKELRSQYKDKFKERHGVNLGFMSFFVKAACHALKKYPRINGWIDGQDLVYHSYCDVGVAVSTEKGLIVPVLRNADLLSFAGVEAEIGRYAEKARTGKISLDDLAGGTFTVSNGGVFGSLMSTPILNPPQSGILGMHKIQDRPMVHGGEIKIRPMMYVALSYDHRIVDGSEAVGFLVTVKECVEDPARLLFDL